MRKYDSERWKFRLRPSLLRSATLGTVSLGFIHWIFIRGTMVFIFARLASATESKTSVIEQSSMTKDTPCNSTRDCQAAIRGGVKCSHKLCICDTSYTRFKNNCLKAKSLQEPCEISDQCAMANYNSYCPSSDTLDAKPSNCRCRKGYRENSDKKCVEDPDQGSLGIYGNPHFDTRDLVPIIMGCLAAGLALCACCAGIVQLMRKKRSLQWRTEREIPQELLYFGSDVQGGRFASPSNTGFPGPELLIDEIDIVTSERFQNDLPPSYEEAIIPPSYEEAMKHVKTSETNL